MTARILIVEDEEPLTLLLRYNLEAEGYSVDRGARRRGRSQAQGEHARPRGARLDAAGPFRHRAIRRLRARPETRSCRSSCSPPAAKRPSACAASRPGRRLYRQALLGARAGGAIRACCAGPSPSGSPARCGRRHRARPREAAGGARRPRRPARPDRIPPPRIPDGASGPRILARAAARRVWGRDVYIDNAPSTSTSAACAKPSTAAAPPI